MKTANMPRIMPDLDDDPPRKRFKDHDLRICTWNVRSLYRSGAVTQLENVVSKYNADITALQEVRWTGQGCCKQRSCDVYYSGHATRHEFGCGFAVGKRLRHLVSRFTAVDERLAAIRIKAKYFYISLICAHAPTEDKDDTTKDAFYDKLEVLYNRCPRSDVKIVVGDFNAKVGREGIFGQTVGKHSLHGKTSDNGFRLVSFAAAQNMVISSTRFQHLDIHKATWQSPDQNTRNQIDHVVIDGRHASSILDVRTLRGANIDSDHYLVAAKVRTRLCTSNHMRKPTQRRLDVQKLRSQQTAESFSTRLSELLRDTPPATDINTQWQRIAHCLHTAAGEKVGYRRQQKSTWYDEECRQAAIDKDAAYQATLRSAATRAVYDRYREKRRDERRLFRRKKHQFLKAECEEIEMHGSRNEARKFFQKIKRMTEGFKTGASFCKDRDGNLVTDVKSSLDLWRAHFNNILNGDDANNSANEMVSPSRAITCDNNTPVTPPDREEVSIAIKRLKSNKASGYDGLPAELFKAGGEDLVDCMHDLLCKIWSQESMPSDWSLSVLCPVLKKGDATNCANYRGISLLSIAYKILSSVLCERLKPFVNKLIGSYQCGFRPGKSTIDQIFTLRQILEKTQEKQIDTHHLFVDFKSAFDSPYRDHLYATMSEFGIPSKLIRLCEMTLRNAKCVVKVGNDLSEPFDAKRGFRQGDSLSCDFFNLLMEKIISAAGLKHNGTIFYKSVMPLAYADDVDIIGRSKREVSAAFSKFVEEAQSLGLAVNEDKTKYLVSTARDSNLGESVEIDSFKFEVVKDFVYLGSSINTGNNISLEIKRRITLASRCYFGLSKQLSKRALSRRTKICMYKSLIMPVLLYGAEAWTLTTADEQALGVFERKILRKIYGPFCDCGDWRIRWNQELYELYGDIDIVKRIKIQRLRWLGHVVRMEDSTPARKVFESEPGGGSRRRGRPNLRWTDQVSKDVSTLGIRNWRQTARNREEWRRKLAEAKTCHRLSWPIK